MPYGESSKERLACMLFLITKCGAISAFDAWVDPPSCFFDGSCPFKSESCSPTYDDDIVYVGY